MGGGGCALRLDTDLEKIGFMTFVKDDVILMRDLAAKRIPLGQISKLGEFFTRKCLIFV